MKRGASATAALSAAVAWLGLLASALLGGPAMPAEPDESWESRSSMGTLLEIAVRGAAPACRSRMLDAAFREADRLEDEFSNWRDSTALSAFNAMAGLGFQPVSADLGALLRLANRLRLDSSGAFDVTLGGAILARRRGERAPPPSPTETWSGRLLTSGLAAALTRPGMAVDLGGIAKGYAVDRICELLERSGAREGLVNFGRSSIRAFGPSAWRVVLPGRRTGPGFTIELRGMALGTSESSGGADAILDPVSGLPASGPATASVRHRSAAVADAWSTAVLVLGRLRATQALAHSEELEVWLEDARGLLHLPPRPGPPAYPAYRHAIERKWILAAVVD